MSQYRKRPVVIEAVQFTGANADEIRSFVGALAQCPSCGGSGEIETNYGPRGCTCLNGLIFIETLEGVMSAFDGDWIIRGVAGEFYPCKPEIFAATYEAVEAQ